MKNSISWRFYTVVGFLFLLWFWSLWSFCTPPRYLPNGCPAPKEGERKEKILSERKGREHPKTYKFLSDFEAYEKIPIVRLKRIGGFEKAIADNGKGNYVPNRVTRFCTKMLKVVLARDYLRGIGISEVENLIGFRFDEKRRILKYKSRWVGYKPAFPLALRGVTKEMVNDYWDKKPYTLEIPHILGNCDLCFLKGKNALISIMRLYPELADKWIADETRTGGTYLNGVSYAKLREIAQSSLFREYDLAEIRPAFDCSCST